MIPHKVPVEENRLVFWVVWNSAFTIKSLSKTGSFENWKWGNRPFYRCVLSCLAFEWKYGFRRNLAAFLMQIATHYWEQHINKRKAVRFLSGRGHLQPHFHTKARKLSKQL